MDLPSKTEMLERATGFLIQTHPDRPIQRIIVERCIQRDGSTLWAVREGPWCLNRDGDWEYEPQPSSRDDDFMLRCRWVALSGAWEAATKARFE